ncbi:hypothetical protein F4861DRAFT_539091 [Xylaria intraflava]|nr:hypothetical protein F4861DRAFT_539091 [Xylaria intraflava]
MASTRLESRPAGQPRENNRASWSRRHDALSHPNASMADDAGEPDVGLRDLIEFFQKTPPPPTNYMSIPDEPSSSEEDNWDKFKRKVFRYRKARKRRPPVIVLPDSAIASRTKAGHRHIAISIPIEYSHLAPLPRSQYPVYDSIEAAFHREINTRFGMWKNPPDNFPAGGLNPVAEDNRESQPSGPVAVRSGTSSGIGIHRSASLREQQRYTPRRAKGLAKTKSLGSAPPTSRYADAPPMPQRSDKRPVAIQTTGETSGQDAPAETPSKDAGASDHPTITLTLPSRRSSKLVKKPALKQPGDAEEDNQKPSPGGKDTGSHWEDYDSGNSNGDPGKRTSFAASILTTGSSPIPQLRQAQTAKAYHSVPIVVRPAGSLAQNLAPGLLSSRAGSQSREQKVREKKERDIVRAIARIGPEKEAGSGESSGDVEPGPGKKPVGKGKEPASRAFATQPDMPSSSYSSSAPSLPKSSESSSPHTGQKGARLGRERFISKALAEEQETLEKLSREEVIRRYELLQEQSMYEREKRLRKLERSRDSWVRAVPVLLQDLNGLLRKQHRLLEDSGLAGSSRPCRQHSRRHRAHSVDVSSRSLSSYRSFDPPETHRSRSLHSSSGSRPSHPSPKVYSEDERPV